MTLERLSAAVASPGLAEAFAACGWLKETDAGVRFVNWRRHNGKSGKARGQANRRQSAYRGAKRGDEKVTRAASRERLPEKRREEKTNH
jgi:hypothetical protein